MKYRILQVITPSRLAGAETLLLRLNARLRVRGHSVRTALNAGNAVAATLRERESANENGGEVLELSIGGKVNGRAVAALRRAAREFEADFTHSHLSTASWWCGWLQTLGGIPSLGHVHGFTSARWHKRQKHLVACSQAVKKHLVAQGIAADKISVLPNPVDAEDVRVSRLRAEVRAEIGTDENALVVGSFAHFSEKKGWRDLVEAVPAVVARFPAVQFWWAGDGPLRAEIEVRARELGVENQVRFLGFRNDAADVMNACDIMALPSHREPFGLVYVEAALLRKPVIACACGGAPEVVSHDETGILVPPHAPDQIAAAVIRLLEDETLRAQMGENAHARALQFFGWDRFLVELEEVYARL